jgi:hypothetical protein
MLPKCSEGLDGALAKRGWSGQIADKQQKVLRF